MTPYSLLWLQVLLVVSLLSSITGRAEAGPKGYPEPWDWQNQNPFPDLQTQASPTNVSPNPEFLPIGRNVSVIEGGTAILPCRVAHLVQHYTVSWIRARDVTVLSVGGLAFSSDQRLGVVEVPQPRLSASDWSLTIVNSSRADQGVYECQVNTDPKIHRKFYLTVTEAPASTMKSLYDDGRLRDQVAPLSEYGGKRPGKHRTLSDGPHMSIQGGPVHYVAQGGEVSLECQVSQLLQPPRTLHWQRSGRPLTARQRPGLSLETERLAGVSRVKLYLAHSEPGDTGNYTCMSDSTLQSTVLLVVTMGVEIPPKGLKGYRGGSASPHLHLFFHLLPLLFPLNLPLHLLPP